MSLPDSKPLAAPPPCGRILLLVLFSALGTRSAALHAHDWPQFFGPKRDGIYRGNDLLATFPADGLEVLWERTVGEGHSAPAVADGRLILFHRKGDEEVVECLGAEDGKPRWSHSYPTSYRDSYGAGKGPRGTPCIASGKVYTFGAEGRLTCLDVDSGKKNWSVAVNSDFKVKKGFFGASCSPLVERDLVLMIVGGGKSGGVVGFRVQDGSVAWKATDHEASYSSPVVATIGDERHALFFTRRGLVSVDPADGRVRWDFYWRSRVGPSVNAANPIVIDRRIFLSTSYGKGAVLLDVEPGGVKEVWKSDDSMTSHYATSVYRKGFLYGHHGRAEYSPALRCVEAATGKVRWSQERFGAGTLIATGDDRLLILGENGELVLAAADPKRFSQKSRFRILSGTVRAYPALARGLLYARDESRFVCVDLRKGR